MKEKNEKKDKKEIVKISTIFIAEVCLILTTLLFTMDIPLKPITHLFMGLLSMSAVLYFGLLSIEAVSVARENIRVTEKANKVIDACAKQDEIVKDIYRRIDDSEKKNETAMKITAQSLQLIMEQIKVLTTPPEQTPEPPKKTKR